MEATGLLGKVQPASAGVTAGNSEESLPVDPPAEPPDHILDAVAAILLEEAERREHEAAKSA